VDILGIYPTRETLIPQIVLLAVTAATFVLQLRRAKKTRAPAAKEA
jgi:high-affinity iron transporter